MSALAPIEEVIQTDGSIVPVGGPVEETISLGKGRAIPDVVAQRINALVAKVSGEPNDPVADEGEPDDDAPDIAPDDPDAPTDPDAPAEGDPAPDDKPDESPDTPKEPDPAAPKPADDVAELERLRAANTKLLAEVEASRKPAEPPPHLAKLHAATESYLDDDIGSLRVYIAQAIGADDPTSKEVDAELGLLYTALTTRELGVTPDPAHESVRQNARTRQLLARQKRERTAEGAASTERAKAEAEATKAREATTVIGNRLSAMQSDFPLLMGLAPVLDGLSPADLVATVIQHQIKAGALPADGDHVKAVAQKIEAHYQPLAERISKLVSPPPSTVTPSAKAPAATLSSAKSATPAKPAEQKGTRTLTNADASVAPATPAKRSATPTTTERPKFKTDAERRDWALRRLPK